MLMKLITGAVLLATNIMFSSGTGVAQNPTLKATPPTLSFLAEQSGELASQTLEVTDTGGGAASGAAGLSWKATLTPAGTTWLKLDLLSGTGKASITATANPSGLPAGVYEAQVTLTGTAPAPAGAAGGGAAGGAAGAGAGGGTPAGAVTIPVTLTVTSPPIPSSANLDWKNRCVDKSLNITGDLQSGMLGMMGEGQWSVGPAVSTQLIKYDLAKKQAGFNTSVGAGAAFRYYSKIDIKDKKGNHHDTVKISEVKRECRETSFSSLTDKSYLAGPAFSITPTLYATKPTDQGDLAVQPALLLGFLNDILNVGVGWNLTGPAGEKGNVFLLFSVGTGFKF